MATAHDLPKVSAKPPLARDWIAAEFSKGINAEERLEADAKTRAQAPPDASLAVFYNDMAAAVARHRAIVEMIATRYGHNPKNSSASGLGAAIRDFKDKVSEMGTTPMQKLAADLASKANAIHWTRAWVDTFESIADSQSARELSVVLTEETSHHETLQRALTKLVLLGAQGELPAS